MGVQKRLPLARLWPPAVVSLRVHAVVTRPTRYCLRAIILAREVFVYRIVGSGCLVIILATVEQDSEACLDWFSTFRTLLVECRWFLVVQFSLRFHVLPTAMAFSAADTWANIALLIVGCLTIMTRHVVAAEECALCPVSAGAGQSPVSLSPSRALCIVQSGAILEVSVTKIIIRQGVENNLQWGHGTYLTRAIHR